MVFLQMVDFGQQRLAVIHCQRDDVRIVHGSVLFQIVLHLHRTALTGHTQGNDDLAAVRTTGRLGDLCIEIAAALHSAFLQFIQRTAAVGLAGTVHRNERAGQRHRTDRHTGFFGDDLGHGAQGAHIVH